MSISVTNRVATGTAGGYFSSITTPSFTPTAGSLLIMTAFVSDTDASMFMTIFDTWGLVWNTLGAQSSNAWKVQTWYAVAQAGAGTVRITPSSGTFFAAVLIDEIDGAISDLVQHVIAFSGGTPCNATLNTAASNADAVYTVVGFDKNTTPTVTGYTMGAQAIETAGQAQVRSAWVLTNAPSATITWNNVAPQPPPPGIAANWATVIELAPVGGPPPPTGTQVVETEGVHPGSVLMLQYASGSPILDENNATILDENNAPISDGAALLETQTAHAGTVTTGQPLTSVTEHDTAHAGVAQAISIVAGHHVTETDAPHVGLGLIVGNHTAHETDATHAGTTVTTTGNIVVNGKVVTETETGHVGAPSLTLVGSRTATTATPHAGSSIVTVLGNFGNSILETETPNAGGVGAVFPGKGTVEHESSHAGLMFEALVIVGHAPGLNFERETPNTAAGIGIAINGHNAAEHDATTAGHAINNVTFVVNGATAHETETPNAGLINATLIVNGGAIVEGDTPGTGTTNLLWNASRAGLESDLARGVSSPVIPGTVAFEVDSPLAGGSDQVNNGGNILELDRHHNGGIGLAAVGIVATEIDIPNSIETNPIIVGTQATESESTHAGSNIQVIILAGRTAVEKDTPHGATYHYWTWRVGETATRWRVGATRVR